MQHTVETLPNGTRVWVNARHRFGSDSLLLAGFCNPRRNAAVCDLGTGCGIILLSLLDKGLAGPAVGVEIDPEGAELLAGAAEENGFANLQSVAGSLCNYCPARLFDLVTANPPYYTGGLVSPNPRRAAARHQISATLGDFCAAAQRLLKDGGKFCICYPAGQLAGLFTTLQSHRLEPKRLQLTRKDAESPPWLALVEARKAGGPGLAILSDRLLPPGQPIQY
ncbi:MAG: tRNA1(Val) (adenine(37)-N6)-methyltransferase [Oscillospiraceae bacterium]